MARKKPWSGSRPPADAASVPKEDTLAVNQQEQLEKLIRFCYIEERAAFESRKHNRPVRYVPPDSYDGKEAVTVDGELEVSKAKRPVWELLTAFFSEHAIDPAAYIRMAFEKTELTRNAPSPLSLRKDQYLFAWDGYAEVAGREIKDALYIQNSVASSESAALQLYGYMSPEDSFASMLLNSSLEISPLFRHCLAASLEKEYPKQAARFAGIAERFEAEAVIQFERHQKHYRQYWAKILPAGFAERAHYIYLALFSGTNHARA